MTTRRSVLGGLLAVGFAPGIGWADAGHPAYLTSAQKPDGSHCLFGLGEDGTIIFERPLPARGHAAAAHPSRPEAVAFARRPGTFALILDCAGGKVLARLSAPPGRHFYGHGTFSADGTILYTTENDYEAARGIVGLWDAARGYARLGEVSSGGVGPHDITRLPGSDVLVVANGGIETHPDSGRAKLNLPTMRPNLSYLDAEGGVIDMVELDPTQRLNSIRHLDVTQEGLVAFAMQWQGDPGEAPTLLGLHRRGRQPVLADGDAATLASMRGYAGSAACSGNGAQVGVSSPRGGVVQVFNGATGVFDYSVDLPDVCGLHASGPTAFVATNGHGDIARVSRNGASSLQRHAYRFDNHLVRV